MTRQTQEALARLFAGTDNARRPSTDDKTRRTKALIEYFKAVEQSVPRDTFDLGSVAATIGREPAKFHQWVREQTTLVPYQGSLRGATGTLMDRIGNSLDRSLLLASLLATRDVQVRLARAQLTAEQLSKLSRPPAILPVRTPAAAETVPAFIDNFASQAGSNAAQIRRQIELATKAARDAEDNLVKRATLQTAVLAKTLGIAPPRSGATSSADLEALQDHWWVQWEDGTEWKDLDPDLSAPGATVTSPDETTDVNSLPDELHHSIHVRVIIEKWDGSALQEEQAITADLRPSEDLGEPLRLRHIPMAWPKQFKGPESDRQRQVREAALAQREWLPALSIGDRQIRGPSILDTGHLNEPPGSKPEIRAPAQSGVLTAEWIEYEIRSPGREPRIIRREVFDLVGPAARAAGRGPQALTERSRLSRALSLLSETEILPLVCQLSPEFVTHLGASRVIAAESILESLAAGAPLDQLSNVGRLPGVLHSFAVTRGQLGRGTASVFIDAPNIVSQHTFPSLDSTGQTTLTSAIDIVANEVAITDAANPQSLARRMAHGVMDANLEALLIGHAGEGGSVADLFPVSDPGAGWVAVRTDQDLSKLSMSPDIKARIQADVRDGFVVVVRHTTDSSTAQGWWRVDPRTGGTLSFGDRGWGQVLAEYANVAATVTFLGCLYFANPATPRLQGLAMCTLMGTTAGGIFLGHRVLYLVSAAAFATFAYLFTS